MKRILLAIMLFTAFAIKAQTGDFVYKTIAIRAKPGELLNLIEMLKKDIEKEGVFAAERPLLMRHSQGDQWDLLMIVPVGRYLSDYYDDEAIDGREMSLTQEKPYGDEYWNLVSWQEEGFYDGPAINLFNRRTNQMSYYHVEMFIALAGKQQELLAQRRMENVYLNEINREPNFIFRRIQGPATDIFTLGLYRDIKHFAESADIPIEKENAAAKKAGFESVYTIGSYLRSLLLEHKDTLAGKVN